MPTGPWLRAQPRDGRTVGPRFRRPGSLDFTARTQPDGLYLSFFRPADEASAVAVSAFVIEVCGSGQNLADKRSRFAPAHAALLVEVEHEWLLDRVVVQGGGEQPRWKLSRAFDEEPKSVLQRRPLVLPVRTLRVLYALPNDYRPKPNESRIYDKLKGSLALEAHEYLVRHAALDLRNPLLRELVRRMLSPQIV